MPPVQSLYLDLARIGAALTVFLSHYATQRISGGLFWQSQRYSHDAVIVFFVLSGYVIAWVTERRETDLRSYTVSRLSRLYSVVLPAILFTAMADGIGRQLAPAIYEPSHADIDAPLLRILAALSFTSECWTANLIPFSNVPFWSLPFEFWFYALFGAAYFLRGRKRLVAVVAMAAIAGPKILLFFPLWLLGVAARRFPPQSPAVAMACFWGAPALYLAMEITGFDHSVDRAIDLTWLGDFLPRDSNARDFLVGALVFLHLLGLAAVPDFLGRGLEQGAAAIRFAAGSSFALYLFHVPLLHFLAALLPGAADGVGRRLAIGAGTLALVAALSFVTERRKGQLRRAIDRAIDRKPGLALLLAARPPG